MNLSTITFNFFIIFIVFMTEVLAMMETAAPTASPAPSQVNLVSSVMGTTAPSVSQAPSQVNVASSVSTVTTAVVPTIFTKSPSMSPSRTFVKKAPSIGISSPVISKSKKSKTSKGKKSQKSKKNLSTKSKKSSMTVQNNSTTSTSAMLAYESSGFTNSVGKMAMVVASLVMGAFAF